MKKYKTITKNQVFDKLCSHASCVFGGYAPFPARLIKEHFETSMYQVRKYIEQLKKDGLVHKISISASEDDECSLPFHGFNLTRKGMKTDTYIKYSEKEYELIREICGVSESKVKTKIKK